jgi:hypothetical protein
MTFQIVRYNESPFPRIQDVTTQAQPKLRTSHLSLPRDGPYEVKVEASEVYPDNRVYRIAHPSIYHLIMSFEIPLEQGSSSCLPIEERISPLIRLPLFWAL